MTNQELTRRLACHQTFCSIVRVLQVHVRSHTDTVQTWAASTLIPMCSVALQRPVWPSRAWHVDHLKMPVVVCLRPQWRDECHWLTPSLRAWSWKQTMGCSLQHTHLCVPLSLVQKVHQLSWQINWWPDVYHSLLALLVMLVSYKIDVTWWRW